MTLPAPSDISTIVTCIVERPVQKVESAAILNERTGLQLLLEKGGRQYYQLCRAMPCSGGQAAATAARPYGSAQHPCESRL